MILKCCSYILVEKVCVRVEVFTAVTMKSAVFWDVTPYVSCKTEVTEECITSIIGVERMSELGTLAVTSN
jgi:hypothetical protein